MTDKKPDPKVKIHEREHLLATVCLHVGNRLYREARTPGVHDEGQESVDIRILESAIERYVDQPFLNNASTRQLMEELVNRGVIGQTLIDDQTELTLNYRPGQSS